MKWWKEVRDTFVFCWREKFKALIIFWIMAGATYAIIPKILILEPDVTPFYHLDQAIPFVSWTVVIYLTLYLQVTLIFLTVRNRLVLRNLFWAYMLGGLLLSLFYFFLPTTHNYPTPVVHCLNYFDGAVLWLRATDVAANQFPSGHAFFSLLGPFLLMSAGRYRKGVLFMLWGALITISTLTVKQHNLVDVVAGGLFAMAFGYLFGESCPRRDD
ncbi:MAG: phosphatase PAP2 family protein [bacterium]|nr:phosphatase PAP2 family protein [bacterium]